jgi:GNAT superfamily N-acetyltransferase
LSVYATRPIRCGRWAKNSAYGIILISGYNVLPKVFAFNLIYRKGGMRVAIQEVPREDVLVLREGLVDIYRLAFTPPPYAKTDKEVGGFKRWLPEHAARSGFRMRLAVDKRTDQPVGFAYGFDHADDIYFLDAVSDRLVIGEPEGWLDDYFRLVEFAVLPEWQGKGIGQRLHDALMSGLPHPTALLATLAQDTPAYRLYLNRGWQVVQPQISFPPAARPYRIMRYSA